MVRTIAIACLLLFPVCVHAQQAEDPRGKKINIRDAAYYPSASALVSALGSSGSQVLSSLEIVVAWDAEGRITDAQLSPATSDLRFDRAVRDWATQIRLKPGEAGHGYVSLELRGRALPPADRCEVIVPGAAGALERVTLRSLNLQNLREEDKFVLPPNAPANVKIVSCLRKSLVPRPTDYKVLAAGLPLSIVQDKRIALMTIEQGHLVFKMVQGEPTKAELQSIGEAVDAAQNRLLEWEKQAAGK